jgi:hypothetical protein
MKTEVTQVQDFRGQTIGRVFALVAPGRTMYTPIGSNGEPLAGAQASFAAAAVIVESQPRK